MDCFEILLIHLVTLPPSQDKTCEIDLLFSPFISFYHLKLQPILLLVGNGSISSGSSCGGSPGSKKQDFLIEVLRSHPALHLQWRPQTDAGEFLAASCGASCYVNS